MNFHADTYKVLIEAPQLRQLVGKNLVVMVHMGLGSMTGKAVLDGTVLDEPACASTFADMTPQPVAAVNSYLPLVSPFSQATDVQASGAADDHLHH
jgi:hypothetical protein